MKTLAIIATLAADSAVRHPKYTVVVVFKNIPSPPPPALIEAIMLVLHGVLSFIFAGDYFFVFASHPLLYPLPAILLICLLTFSP